MASPITWRNVGTTANSSGVGSLLESARRSADSGFAAVQGVFDKAEQTADANREVIKGNNTADFIRQLNSYGSAEEYQAALESGALDQQLDSYGRMVDPSVAAQMFSQGDKYRDRDTSRNQFADDQTLRGQRGLEDQIQKLTAAGKFDEAKPLIDQLQMNSGEFAQDVRQAEVADKKLGWEEGRYQLAQAAGARAQQSHQMQMQQAREAQRQLQLQRDSQQFVMEGLRTRQQEMDTYRQGTAQVMQDLGYNPEEFGRLGSEDRSRVVAELNARGLKAPPTDSEFLRMQNEQALNDPSMTPEMLVRITQGTDQLLNSSNQVAASDQAKLEAAEAAAAATQAYNEQVNPYYSPAPVAEQLKSLEPMTEDRLFKTNFLSIGTNQAEAKQKFTKWLSDGITVEDSSGRDVTVPLTAPAIEEIMKYTGWTDSYNLDSRAEDWVKQNLEQLKAAAALRSESAARIQSISEQRKKLLNKDGGTGVSDAMIDSMRFIQP